MNRLGIISLLSLLISMVACGVKEDMESVYSPKYELLKVGQVTAAGWMLEQMNIDLTVGYLSSFDKICPYIDQDVFNAKRVGTNEKYPDYPNLGNWWGAEEEGYLKDGMLRMAIQSGNKEVLARAKGWMERLLEYQGEDGYIGMYIDGKGPDTRFTHEGDNGELWCQSRIMSPMLAWYEYTNDSRFLEAVEAAVMLDIKHYKDNNYFEGARGVKGSGVTHSVGFFDILEWLIRLTGKQEYIDYTKVFFEGFNEVPMKNNEMALHKLKDKDLKFTDHTPHIVEGAYMTHLYAALTQNQDVAEASKTAMDKVRYHFTPGGGVVGDEDVKSRQGTADTYREYCALPELVFSLNRVASISGQVEVSDMVERLVFNAAQGARFPDLTALEYLSKDNHLHIKSYEHGGRCAFDANRAKCVGKEMLVPFEQGAVCCVTSASRILPYYIDGMWMKTVDQPGVVAMCYGPTIVTLDINGTSVKIEEVTDYPFSDDIKFKLTMDKSQNFDFKLRIPEGVETIQTDVKGKVKRSDDDQFVTLNKTWKNGDIVSVNFPFEVKKIAQPVSRTVPREGYYLQRGPLVYAIKFPYEVEKTLEYNNTGYYRYEVITLDETGWKYAIDADEPFVIKKNPNADLSKPWFESPVYLEGRMKDENGKYQTVKLVPEGATIVRRVTFPGI